MGGSYSLDYLNHLIRTEVEQIRQDKERDYLTLSEVLQMKPPREISISFYHIGTLFTLDEDKDGRFTLTDL